MAAKRKSWRDKRASAKPDHVVVLDRPFAGVPAGMKLLIPSPRLIEDYAASIPPGRTRTLAVMRADLARAAGADAACPVTTSIFARIAAEAALEDIASGKPLSDTPPFWRVIGPRDPVAAKLSCGPEFIEQQRLIEAQGIAA